MRGEAPTHDLFMTRSLPLPAPTASALVGLTCLVRSCCPSREWWLGAGLLGLTCLCWGGCRPSACPESCETGFVCDSESGRCRPQQLESYEGTAPGRFLELAATDERTYMAALEPREQQILIGSLRADGPQLRVLARLEELESTHLALAARDGRAAIAWRNRRGDYRIAERDGDRWRLRSAIRLEDQTYRATRDFDLGIDADGGLHLVFYDRSTSGLRRLMRPEVGPWRLESIDDGQQVEHTRCSDTPSRGVGRHPDLAWSEGELFVAYYDAQCRDLHLARYAGNQWRVVLVDEGSALVDAGGITSARDVGQFVSIETNSQGRVAMAYFDSARGQLRFARQTESHFELQIVDPGLVLGPLSQQRKRLVGSHVDLAFDREAPRILYLDGTRVQLRYARRARGSSGSDQWIHRALEPSPPIGFHANLSFPKDRGPVAAAERLSPGDDGLQSQLVTLGEDAL